MSGTCRRSGGTEKLIQLWLETLKGKDCLGDLSMDERKILKWVLKK
jgi:hypothetical protein